MLDFNRPSVWYFHDASFGEGRVCHPYDQPTKDTWRLLECYKFGVSPQTRWRLRDGVKGTGENVSHESTGRRQIRKPAPDGLAARLGR